MLLTEYDGAAMRPQPSPLGFAEGPFFGLPAGPSSRIARFGLWISVCWLTIFWRLSFLPLLDPDEAHYAEITREMRRLGDYLVPRMDGVPLIDKPALFHWLQAGSFALFGENEFAARLPTALAALALIWTTYWLGKRLFGAETAERGALMFAMTPLSFALARFAYFDMIVTAFLFGSIALLTVSAMERRRWLQVPAFLLLSLAAQIKGPFVFIVLPTAVLVSCLSKETGVYVRRIAWIPGLLVAGILALPWFVAMWHQFGDAFIRDYVLYNNVQLFAAPLYRKQFDAFFYLRSGAASLFPWSLVLVGLAIDTFRYRRHGEPMSPRRVILWAWVVVVVVFFSASRFKLDHYIFPMLPALCLLVADGWQRAGEGTRARFAGFAASLAVVSFCILVFGVAGIFEVMRADLRLPATTVALPGLVLVAAVWLAATLVVRGFKVSRSRIWWPLVTTLGVVYLTILLGGLPVLKSTRPGANLGLWLKSQVSADSHIIIFNQGRWKASMRYYADHPVQQTTVNDELIAAWRLPTRVYGVMIEPDLHVLRDAGLPYRIVHAEPAVIANLGRLVRRQIWGQVVVVTNDPPSPAASARLTSGAPAASARLTSGAPTASARVGGP
jgi:4-amino-4-deoxy-L-arabinose transferase-like glycosyltransferase